MIEYNKFYEEIFKLLTEEETEFENRSNIIGIIEKLTQHLENLDIKRNNPEICDFVYGQITIKDEQIGSLHDKYLFIVNLYSGEDSIYFHGINRILYDYFSIYENDVHSFEKSDRKKIKNFFYNVFRLEVDELSYGPSFDRSPLLNELNFSFQTSSCEEIKSILEYLNTYDTPLNRLEIKSLDEELSFLFNNDLDKVYPVIKIMVSRKVLENIHIYSNFKTTYSFFEYDFLEKKEIYDKMNKSDSFQIQLNDKLYDYVNNKDSLISEEAIDSLENIIQELKTRNLDNIHNELVKELDDKVESLKSEREDFKTNETLHKAIHTPILNNQFFNSNFRLNDKLSQAALYKLLGQYKENIVNRLKDLIKNNQSRYPEIRTLNMCQFDINYILYKHNRSIDNVSYFDLLFENYNLRKSGHTKNETILLSMIERGRNNEKTK